MNDLSTEDIQRGGEIQIRCRPHPLSIPIFILFPVLFLIVPRVYVNGVFKRWAWWYREIRIPVPTGELDVRVTLFSMIRLHQERLDVIVCPGDVVTLDYRAPVSLWSDGRLVETIGRDHSQPDQDAASDQQRETEPHSAVPGSSEPDRWPDEIDVFVLTDQRDHVHVQAFIDSFVDVDKSQYRGLERLQVLPTGRTEEDSLQLNDWELVPVRTLDEIINLGLGHPHRAFRVDLDARAPIADAGLTFTTDSKVYFGLSLDDMEDPASSMAFAHKLLNRLLFVIDGAEGWIVEDGVAPLDSGQPMPFNGAYVAAHRRRVDPPLEN